ncbi:MAG: 50S ribosome-binding GTPase [Nanoarchaeota archaeon]|nr:50S ribosome-binding GTPase [Nanoarchaeota archaeon]
MKQDFWSTVENVIKKSDVVLHVIDSRYPEESRNTRVEKMALHYGKGLIHVFTKFDLVEDKDFAITVEGPFCLFSAVDYYGLNKLRDRIIIEGKRRHKERPMVGVVGYPNVGKSSLINAFKGKKSASTSSEPGHTKGKQLLGTRNFMFVDTPGVIPVHEGDNIAKIKMGMKSVNEEDVELAAIEIMEQEPGKVEAYFEVEVDSAYDETLEKIALKKKQLLKGGTPDTQRAARVIVRLFSQGKL